MGFGLAVRVHTVCSVCIEYLYVWSNVDQSAELTSYLWVVLYQVLGVKNVCLNMVTIDTHGMVSRATVPDQICFQLAELVLSVCRPRFRTCNEWLCVSYQL